MTAVSGIVVAHAELAGALVEAAERISGIEGVLQPVSNDGLSPDSLHRELIHRIDKSPAILFADLASGSCAFGCHAVARGRSSVAVVTGVNLPMLIDFLFNREMELEPLAERVLEKGRAGLTVRTFEGGGDAARPVSD